MDFSIAALFGVAEDASAWSNVLSVAWRVLIVLLGVNMLVIVHEFGHFIVARMCGVRCDKFFIWFDAYGFKFFSFKRGDTEYGLGWLPLGGYVKMFGQEDSPGGIQAEIDRAKVERDEKTEELSAEEKQAQDAKIKALENQLYAPDSYLAKNVFQRMAIISAGVIMNIIFAIVCASLASVIGTPETSAKIGYVAPGSPAWCAGLQAGDEIVAINDDAKPIFSSILVACMDGKELTLRIARQGESEPREVKVTPKKDKGDGSLTPMIGVGPSVSLELGETPDRRPYEAFLSLDDEKRLEEKLGALKGGERLVSINGKPVATAADYFRLIKRMIDQPITYEFAPTVVGRGGERFIDESKQNISVTLEPVRVADVGVRLTMGEIVTIRPGSIAEKVGLRAREVNDAGEVAQHGDVVLEVNNQPVLDPLTFPYMIFDLSGRETIAVDANDATFSAPQRSITLTVAREGERKDFEITLPQVAPYEDRAASKGRLACDTLGFAYEVKPIVAGIDGTATIDESPLGGKIKQITAYLRNPGENAPESLKATFKSLTGKKVAEGVLDELTPASCVVDLDKETELERATKVLNWFANVMQYLPNDAQVEIKALAPNGETATITTKVKRDQNAFVAGRGLIFGVDVVHQRADSFCEALDFGVDKTIDAASQVFIFLKNIGKNVSAKALGGPGMIVGTAYQAAGRPDGVFLLFLCLISANLAVVNFLPIPVLDGGHMVFLLYEMITRRKPNEKIQIILSYIGFVLILALMFWVIGLDIWRYCFN